MFGTKQKCAFSKTFFKNILEISYYSSGVNSLKDYLHPFFNIFLKMSVLGELMQSVTEFVC